MDTVISFEDKKKELNEREEIKEEIQHLLKVKEGRELLKNIYNRWAGDVGDFFDYYGAESEFMNDLILLHVTALVDIYISCIDNEKTVNPASVSSYIHNLFAKELEKYNKEPNYKVLF